MRSVTEQRREWRRKSEERHPLFNFARAEELALCSELGLELDKLMYMPCTYLLDDGVIRRGHGWTPAKPMEHDPEALPRHRRPERH